MDAETSAEKSTVSTHAVLRLLGFRPDTTVYSDPAGGLTYEFADFVLHASVCVGQHFEPVVLFTGVISRERVLAEINFEMPQEVESADQAVAWLTYALRHYLGGEPQKSATEAWLARGQECSSLLPWERRRAEYDARPYCIVAREWMKLAVRQLSAELEASDDDVRIAFWFDGEVLRIEGPMETIVLGARGTAWKHVYEVHAGVLRKLPRRFMTSSLEIGVWDDRLTIGRHLYAIADRRPGEGGTMGQSYGSHRAHVI